MIINILLLIFIPIICGILGSLGGAEKSSKLFRRIGIPLVLLVVYSFYSRSFWSMLILCYIWPLCTGYGIPDPPDRPNPDKGSPIGRFWLSKTHQNYFMADILTRSTIGTMFAIILGLIAIWRRNPFVYAYSGSMCITGLALTPIIWNKLGSFSLFGKKLLWGETIIYWIISIAALIQVILT